MKTSLLSMYRLRTALLISFIGLTLFSGLTITLLSLRLSYKSRVNYTQEVIDRIKDLSHKHRSRSLIPGTMFYFIRSIKLSITHIFCYAVAGVDIGQAGHTAPKNHVA